MRRQSDNDRSIGDQRVIANGWPCRRVPKGLSGSGNPARWLDRLCARASWQYRRMA